MMSAETAREIVMVLGGGILLSALGVFVFWLVPEEFYKIMANAYRNADAMMKAREQK